MSKKETNSIHVISNIGKNELTISKEFIKKTAKNTLKHLKGTHPTLTLSELTEALSKGLGFNNFHAVKNTPEFPSFENEELHFYYPHVVQKIHTEDQCDEKSPMKELTPLEKEKIFLLYKKHKENKISIDDAEKALWYGMRNNPLVRWDFPVNVESINLVIKEILKEMSDDEQFRFNLLKTMLNIDIFDVLNNTDEKEYLKKLIAILDYLIENNSCKNYMDYIQKYENESYVKFNYNKDDLKLSLQQLKIFLIRTIENSGFKIKDVELFDLILLFFRVFLNNNMFYSSLKEKIIYLILSKKELIESNNVKFFNLIPYFPSYHNDEFSLNYKMKMLLVEQCLNSFYPDIHILKNGSFKDKNKGMFYFDDELGVMNIQL